MSTPQTLQTCRKVRHRQPLRNLWGLRKYLLGCTRIDGVLERYATLERYSASVRYTRSLIESLAYGLLRLVVDDLGREPKSGLSALHGIVYTSIDHADRSSHDPDLKIRRSCPHRRCSVRLLVLLSDCCGVGACTPELVSPCPHVASSCAHPKLAV